ncbi:OLC1v1034284C1 [Oldenlandia corymbosa var. corymbosa]|uniref:OLC1v1034284C1 n=1 Tax=Oldenlandia corymbosa var. corymbosa TaxID=529605 RepID=A0AAV1CQY9_OLDCO|nr:OLC1v1034284C1 [Oldenlandia corymbosa var. corymbosa]
MATNRNTGEDDGEFVIVKCIDPNDTESELDEFQEDGETISISTSDVDSWDLPSILAHKTIHIKASRNRLIDNCSYFRGLLCGSFSESCRSSVSIRWNKWSFLSILRFIFGCSVDLYSNNFIILHEAALFFGVETLLSHCQIWLSEVTSKKGPLLPLLELDVLIDIWKYGLEHVNDLISQICIGYLAKNFVWASSCKSFVDVPYQLLYSCIQHPFLTVDSEKFLCDAILLWLYANVQQSGYLSINEDACTAILRQIRCNLLPLGYLAGKRRCSFFSKFADRSLDDVLSLSGYPSSCVESIAGDDQLSGMTIRLTEYSKKVDLSGCPQIRIILLSSLIPSSKNNGIVHHKNIKQPSLGRHSLDVARLPTFSFEAVEEVDISNSSIMDLEEAVKLFCKSFPSLGKLRAANYLNFGIEKLNGLLANCPLLCDLDLAVDFNPLVPAKVSIVSSSLAPAPTRLIGDRSSWASLSFTARGHSMNTSTIVRLSLEGRSEISDSDLQAVAISCASLCFLNISGCLSVTDAGISFVILNCLSLESLLACDTSFGPQSVLALCSIEPIPEDTKVRIPLQSRAYKLQTLHIGGCSGVPDISLSELLSQTRLAESICLRETQLGDDALYRFQGCSLKMLDVSETKVTSVALAHVVNQNPGLKCLKARGCKYLSIDNKTEGRVFSSLLHTSRDLYSELGSSCKLSEFAIGWGFSWFALQTLKPAVGSLRTLVVGLGASLGPDGLKLLPFFCPSLETLVIYFQVISDSVLVSVMQSFEQLQVLALCYCSGEISSLSFQFSMPSLRKLKLERVAAWMTNADLVILTQSCMNLVELSLTGCKRLNAESQDIISSGWPGLTSIHLEDCGEVTTDGVSSLMNCRALEDLLLRHTGHGILKNVIAMLTSEMPMLRKISLDICDAKDSDFDIPDFSGRGFLSTVKIAKCKMQRSHLDLNKMDFRKAPVHKETLVMVWDSKKLARSVVTERL